MNTRENEVIGQVRQALAHDPKLVAPRINITMIEGALALSGVLDTQEEVIRAEQIARTAAPGVAIDNGLTVSMSQDGSNTFGVAGERHRQGWHDSELQPDAEQRLAKAHDALVNQAGNVGVEVVNGLAHLQGSVGTVKDRLALIAAVAGVPGLKRVIADGLRVAPFGTADDSRLGSLAVEKLQQLAPDLAATVTIDVRDRGAHLIGSVREGRDRLRAEDAVSQVPGITRVHNDLRLYQDEGAQDVGVQIEQAIRHALTLAALPAPNIRAFYTTGLLSLDGEVESVDQHRMAVLVAHEAMHRVTGESHQISDNLKIASRQGHQPIPESRLHGRPLAQEPETAKAERHRPPVIEQPPGNP